MSELQTLETLDEWAVVLDSDSLMSEVETSRLQHPDSDSRRDLDYDVVKRVLFVAALELEAEVRVRLCDVCDVRILMIRASIGFMAPKSASLAIPFRIIIGRLRTAISPLRVDVASILLRAMFRCSRVSNSTRTLLFEMVWTLAGAKSVSWKDTPLRQLARTSL